jgi:F-type H+-transporting ATPase subunit b
MEALGISGLALLAQIVNFVIILFLLNRLAVGPITRILAERRERIEQGLKDAEQARADRERAEQERLNALQEARREANDILARAQKVAQETREADIAATREELERLRSRATEEIDAEKQRKLNQIERGDELRERRPLACGGHGTRRLLRVAAHRVRVLHAA